MADSVIRRWPAAGDGGDLDAFDQLLHPDVHVHAPGSLPTTRAAEKKAAWRDANTAVVERRHEVQEVVLDGGSGWLALSSPAH